MSTLDNAKAALVAAGPTPKMEAFIETMYLAAHADGSFDENERNHFVANILGLCGGKMHADEVKGVLLKLRGKAAEGREPRLKSIAGRLPRLEDREHAFALAYTMALADNVVVEKEKTFFLELSAALGISDERASEILEELNALEPEA